MSGVAWLPGTSQLLVFAQGPGIEGIPLSNIWRVETAARNVEPLVDFTSVEGLNALLELDETGYAHTSYAPFMPVLMGDSLIMTAINRPDAEAGRIVLRRFPDLSDNNVSDVIYAFEDVSLTNMLRSSVSADGKVILNGYLIELSG
jgi:hypothetical protein